MLNHVGQRIPRYDALGHVTGATRYVGDITVPGALTVKVLRSPIARGVINNLDVSAAERLPGVIGVITAADVPNNNYGFYPDQPVLVERDIRFFGQPIAAVAAIDEDTALEALGKIKTDITELVPILDPKEAMKPDAVQIRPEGNVYEFEKNQRVRKVRKGNVDEAFAKADILLESDYSTPPQEHAMIEPACAMTEIDASGRLIVHTVSQAIFFHLGLLAGVLQLPFNKINMTGGTVGGGFGGRNDLHAEHIPALLTLKTQKPCRWQWTREEEMLCSQWRGAWQFHIKDGVRQDGKIIARQIESIHDCGAYAGFGPYAVDKSCFTITGPYDIENVWIDGYCVFTNKQVATSMRGFGINVGQFAVETHMEKIAETLGISPWELRLKNAWKEGVVSSTMQKMHAVAMIETLQGAAQMAGVELSAEYAAMRSK